MLLQAISSPQRKLALCGRGKHTEVVSMAARQSPKLKVKVQILTSVK